MKTGLLTLFSVLPVLFLIAVGKSSAQTPQRDNRPRTASISGRVTIGGEPAVNAVVTVAETDLKPDAGSSEAPIPRQVRTRTDGDGRYLVSGLVEGRYFVNAMLKAFVDPGKPFDNRGLNRTVTLDEGEAREKIDFTLIRGGVMTGKVMDDEGAPLIAKRVDLYTLDEQGRKNNYQGPFMYEMSQTDDRGVYRIYGLPPGRYVICAGGGGDGKFATTWYPDTTDEKQARVIEIKEGSEVTEVDIRFGSARKTYEVTGRVVDRDTGKPVPRIYVSCGGITGKDGSGPRYSNSAAADGQGAFRVTGLPPGRYQAMIADYEGKTGYTSEATEFEITNDNVSDVEVKVFQGATISGVVVIEGADALAKNKLRSMSIVLNNRAANGASPASYYPNNVKVNADGGFTLRGFPAGKVSFMVISVGSPAPIKRIERDGVEIKDAIEVRPGEEITGVRIMLYQAQGRIRGQVQITGGALPDGLRLSARATRSEPAGEANPSDRIPVTSGRISRSAFIDDKGRFVIEDLPAGEYNLSINAATRIANGIREDPLQANQRVTVSENAETPVTITIDLNKINQPGNQPNNRPNNREDHR
jgi:carboxypeptidase family protein